MTTTRYSSGIYADKKEPLTAVIDLSEREMKIIQMIADGLYNKEIAGILNLSLAWTRLLITNLYLKLGIPGRRGQCRVGLVRLAIRKGWVKA